MKPKKSETQTPEQIHSRIAAPARDDMIYRELYCLDGVHTVKIDIRVNSYDFQSHARAEIWSPQNKQWNHISDIVFSEMASLKVSGPVRAMTVQSFQPDALRLKQDVKFILGYVPMVRKEDL